MAALASLFVTSLMPVLQVLLLTATGATLSLQRVDILGVAARSHMNNVVFYVFMPALVGSNLAKYVTFKSLVSLWFMPVNVFITFVVGSFLGWAVNKITKAPPHLRGLVVGICATGNLGNLSFIMIPAVCNGKDSPFGDVGLCHGRAMAYATISMAFGNIFMWSYVYNLMRRYSSSSKDGITANNISNNQVDDCPDIDLEALHNDDNSNGWASPPPTTTTPLPLTGGTEKGKATVLMESVRNGFQRVGTKLELKRLFAPTTIAAIVGLAIAVNPLFRKALIGDNAPLHVVQDTAYMLGQAAIPCLTIIMGANLLKGLKGSRAMWGVICGVLGMRNIVLPVIGVGVLKAAKHFGMVEADPLFQFVLLLQFAMPPAVNIGTITQLFGVGESECSVIMLFSYALASVSLTLWSMFFMWFVG